MPITKTRRVLNFLWVALIAAGLAVMVVMLIWSLRLKGDFSGRYESKDFHQRFWSMFYRGEELAFVGCLGLSVTLPFRIAIRAGLWTLGVSSVLLFMVLFGLVPLVNFHDWTGASAFTIGESAFCGGAAMAVIGSLRLGWRKLST
jgi:ABC-type uncharacterized transport system permease subunit